MKFNELLCVTNLDSSTTIVDSCISKDNVYIAKEIFQEHMPIYKIETISGYELILADHFSDVLVIALSTDYIERMSRKEKAIFKDFVKYENYLYSGISQSYEHDINKLIAIDTWLYNEVMNITNKNLNDDTTCGNNTLNVCDFK